VEQVATVWITTLQSAVQVALEQVVLQHHQQDILMVGLVTKEDIHQ
jgi:hypothetical protein